MIGLTLLTISAPQTVAAADRRPTETAVLAGGCYWGVEAVFEHVDGVLDVTSGFAGGRRAADGKGGPVRVGYAEAVRIKFDPARTSYDQLLQIFFGIAHDPTQLNRQGPDVGPQYRSAIFPQDSRQRSAAISALANLQKASPGKRITTRIEAGGFQPAVEDQQDYVRKNPKSRYVVVNDLPKLAHLRRAYPQLRKSR